MNLKHLISSQKIRHRILKLASFIPDKWMLMMQYHIVLSRWPNLKHPKRFTEWIQVYKMCYRNPDMLQCVDKYKVREFVVNRGCKQYLNDLYQICEEAKDIDLKSLPDKFVIKTTDGGNGDNVMIVREKKNFDLAKQSQIINRWKGKQYYHVSREWAYRGAKHSRIIIEKLLESDANSDGSIDDYKFLCFDGKFKYLWIDKDRYSNHRRGFWNEQLDFLPDVTSDHPTFEAPPILPANISEMISIAEKLAAGFPFVRVDLYNISGKIIFGELTFYPWSGYVQYTPDTFDFALGNLFKQTFWAKSLYQ